MPQPGFTTVTISDALDKVIAELAKAQERSKAWIVEKAIELYKQKYQGGEVERPSS